MVNRAPLVLGNDGLPQNIQGADTLSATIVSAQASGTGSIARALSGKLFERPVSVLDFGAKGDGTTDDTAAFVAAMAASASVYIPAKTYLVSPFTVPDGVKLQGEGALSLLTRKAGTTGDLITLAAGSKGGTVLRDFAIFGNSGNVTDITASGIYGSGFFNLTIENVTSNSNKKHGILLVNNNDKANYSSSRVLRCSCTSNGSDAIRFNTGQSLVFSKNIGAANNGAFIGDFVDQSAEYTGDGSTKTFSFPMHIMRSGDIRVVLQTLSTGAETVLTYNTDYTMSAFNNPQGGMITLSSAPASTIKVRIQRRPPQSGDVNNRSILSMSPFQSENILIEGNTSITNYGCSFYLQNQPNWDAGQAYPNPIYGYEQQIGSPYSRNVQLIGNSAINASIGFITRCWNALISGNTVNTASNSGYVPQGKYLTIVGNKAINCGSVGFDLGCTQKVEFTGNHAQDCQAYGVEIHGSVDLTCSGNVIDNCCLANNLGTAAGIVITNSNYYSPNKACTGIVVVGNRVTAGQYQTYGIGVIASTSGYTVSGVIITGNDASGAGTTQDIFSSQPGVIVTGNRTSLLGDNGNILGGGDVRIGGYGNTNDAALRVTISSAPANHVKINSGNAGQAPTIAAEGDDSNIDLFLVPKGGGTVSIGPYTSNGDAAITGYIYVKDTAGTLRKLATIA